MSRARITTNTKTARHQGFTLIELSIVLVIIGLIVGGVLVGQNLIRAAAVRSTLSDFEKYKTAAQTFRTKYDCYSGDCANATQFFGYAGDSICTSGGFLQWGNGFTGSSYSPSSGTCNGYGKGQITPAQDGGGYQHPGMGNILFWDHLARASLIPAWTPVPYSGPTAVLSPQNALNTYFTIGWLDNMQNISGTVFGPIAPNYVFQGMVGHNLFYIGFDAGVTGSIPPAAAYAIDSKIDDGSPTTGSVFGEGANGQLVDRLYNTGCVTPTNPAISTSVYDLSQNGTNCNMALYAGF